jgi:IS30 family transposase
MSLVNLRMHSTDHLRAVEDELNNRPRLVLDGCTPTERFAVLLASEKLSVLRR